MSIVLILMLLMVLLVVMMGVMMMVVVVVVVRGRRKMGGGAGRRTAGGWSRRVGAGAAETPASAGSTARGRRRGRVGVGLFDEDLGPLVELFALHAAVLEPDFDLALAEMQLARDLPALLARDVRVADELVLEHHRLVASVRLPLLALPRQICAHAQHAVTSRSVLYNAQSLVTLICAVLTAHLSGELTALSQASWLDFGEGRRRGKRGEGKGGKSAYCKPGAESAVCDCLVY